MVPEIWKDSVLRLGDLGAHRNILNLAVHGRTSSYPDGSSIWSLLNGISRVFRKSLFPKSDL